MKKLIFDLIIRFNKDDVPSLGSQLAYNLLLSFFPFMIFLMTLIRHTFSNKIEIISGITSILPDSISYLINHTLFEISSSQNGSLMSLSLIITIWSASSGFNAVIKGVNKAYNIKEHRSFIKVRLVSILCTLGMSLIIIIMMILLVFGTVIWGFLSSKVYILKRLTLVWISTKYLIIIFTAVFIFSALYRYSPSKKLSWEEVYPGSIFSTFSLILASIAFSYYVNNFGKYSIVYGSLGAIIILLLWLFLVSIIIILGGEINASLSSNVRVSPLNPKKSK